MNNKVRGKDKLKTQVKLQDVVLQYYHMTIFGSHPVGQMIVRNKITRVITFRQIIQYSNKLFKKKEQLVNTDIEYTFSDMTVKCDMA